MHFNRFYYYIIMLSTYLQFYQLDSDAVNIHDNYMCTFQAVNGSSTEAAAGINRRRYGKA